MASKRDQFLTACRNAKLDTVRWGLGAGGQNPGTRDDDGYTAIMITAMGNKHKALQMLLDNCRRSRIKEPIDFVDGCGDERTALMMAAERGYVESCDELLYAGANFKMKCAKGRTAADYARKNGHDALARKIDRGGDSSEEEEEEEEEEDAAFEGETSTQRSKRKKKELEALERRGDKGAKGGKDKSRNDDAEEADVPAGKAPEPRWPETVKAMESSAKELAIERSKGDTEVDPALFYVNSVNNLKLRLGSTLVKLSPDISRLSGLLTLIISGNGLTELPDSIGKLKNLKVLEAEDNALASLPSSLAQCKNLEILRVSRNKIKSLAPLENANNLVTLVADNNQLTTLDDFTIEAKERLVTLSARMNKITDAPADIHQCTLLAEIFLKSNKIEDLPGEWGELKEKKVREIELDGNPIADPKVKKMMGKSANFVKELLTYLRKNGKKSAGKKKKKAAKKAESEDESADDADDEPAPEPSKPAAVAPSKAAPEAADDDDDQSETEEELEARMAKMNKKEREKFKRKLAEERQAKAAREAEQKRKAADAAAAARLQAAKTMGDDDIDIDGDSDIDSDDEMALLQRRKKAAGKKPAGFLYAMTDEQKAAAEKAEADRLLAIELEKQAAEEAKKDAEAKAAAELAGRVKGVKLTGEGVYGWEYKGGQFVSSRVPALPRGAKGPCVELEIPKIIVGKLIGQKGATIKGVQDRSKAMVSIDETKAGSGNALLRVRGDESCMESARMLLNNALSGKR
jgi:leucine-rich repeat protein SHOC2